MRWPQHPGSGPRARRPPAGLILLFLLPSLLAPGCAARRPSGYDQEGMASWYGPGFHGKRAADGSRYSQYQLTAAHRTLPLGSVVRVTNVENGRSVRVVITDRGPFVKGRLIDLSWAAARRLKMARDGLTRVRIEVLELGD